MTAQAQECAFEGLSLPAPAAPHDCLAQLRLAQEAAQVRAGGPGQAPWALVWAWPSCAALVAQGPRLGPRQGTGEGDRTRHRGRHVLAVCRGRVSYWFPKLAVVLAPEGPVRAQSPESLPRGQRSQGTEGTDPGRAQPGTCGRAAGTASGPRPQGGEPSGLRLLGGAWLGPSWSPRGAHCHVCRQVAAEYELVHGTMAQPPVREYVPFAWTTLVHVKAKSFRALAHYHAAVALCGGPCECPAPWAVHRGGPDRGSRPSPAPSGRARAPGAPAGLPRAPGRATAAGARGAQEAG